MRHVLSAVVQNVPGVLAHISGMLASRGYNIDSLAVGETEDPQPVADDVRRRRATTASWSRSASSWRRSSPWSASTTSVRRTTWNAT